MEKIRRDSAGQRDFDFCSSGFVAGLIILRGKVRKQFFPVRPETVYRVVWVGCRCVRVFCKGLTKGECVVLGLKTGECMCDS